MHNYQTREPAEPGEEKRHQLTVGIESCRQSLHTAQLRETQFDRQVQKQTTYDTARNSLHDESQGSAASLRLLAFDPVVEVQLACAAR